MIFCRDCIHLHGEANAKKPWEWLCVRHPRQPEVDRVSGELSAPYRKCRNVRVADECEDYQEGPNVLRPKGTTDV